MKNDPIFAAMKAQLAPSRGAQETLLECLAAERAAKKEEKYRMRHWKPLVLAACAVLSLCIYPIYNLFAPQAPALHSYVLADASDPVIKAEYRQQTGVLGGDTGIGGEGPNTGDLPGGAYIGDVPVQLGAEAYQLLMAHFGDTLPDWYGGAYIDDSGALMVLLVEGKDPADKSLELEVLGAVGDVPVAFTDVKYSLIELQEMNEKLLTLLDGSGVQAGWGIYEDQNRIVLDVPESLSDELLAAIAKIDPEDDAILIRVVEEMTAFDLVKGPPAVEPTGGPAVPGGVTEPMEKLPAVVQNLPGEKETPASYDILPLELE